MMRTLFRIIGFKRKPWIVLLLVAPVAAGMSTLDLAKVAGMKAGDPSLQEWLLPATPPYPAGNAPTPARVALGKMLFFDPRVGGDGNMSCATCHNPVLGWSDGLATAKGLKSKVLARATPTIVNTAYNSIQMWDGRKRSLEEQATEPMKSPDEMNTNMARLLAWLNANAGYRQAFAQAYPGRPINQETLATALASFERTILSNNSAFDRWVRGDAQAMTAQQVRGFHLFIDETKGNCVACHQPPNFTDDGFHNIGLKSFGDRRPDVGRYAQKPLRLMKGAFKTPTLREVALTAPYFHDGSAKTLLDVVEHYAKGGEVTTRLSPNIKPLRLSHQEKKALVAFMQALTSAPKRVVLPVLPQ